MLNTNRLSCEKVARLTGLEPATPGVTGRYSNQLSYNRAWGLDYAKSLEASIAKYHLWRKILIHPLGPAPKVYILT